MFPLEKATLALPLPSFMIRMVSILSFDTLQESKMSKFPKMSNYSFKSSCYRKLQLTGFFLSFCSNVEMGGGLKNHTTTWRKHAFSGHKGQTGPTHQLECHGLLVESLHVRQTSLHLGLDVALISSWKPDPCDPLERSGRGQTKSWTLELLTAYVVLLLSAGCWDCPSGH